MIEQDAKRITAAVLAALTAGGDHLAIYQAVLGALGGGPDIITTAEMDAIERAAIAGRPLNGRDIGR